MRDAFCPHQTIEKKSLNLWSNVLASQWSNGSAFVNIQTNSLTIYPQRDYAETDEPVFIDNQSGRTTAAGMKAFLDTGKFMFYSTPTHRVTTIFLPN